MYERCNKIAFSNTVKTRKDERALWRKKFKIQEKSYIYLETIYEFNFVIIRVFVIFLNMYILRLFERKTEQRTVRN